MVKGGIEVPNIKSILDIQDYERASAALKLMNELAKGKRFGEEKGWHIASEIRAHFREKVNEGAVKKAWPKNKEGPWVKNKPRVLLLCL